MKTVRIYSVHPINTWSHIETIYNPTYNRTYDREVIDQFEYSYREYDVETGELRATGTEDFSRERNLNLKNGWPFTWDGESYYPSGRRRFTEWGLIRFDEKDRAKVRDLYKNNHHAKSVQIR